MNLVIIKRAIVILTSIIASNLSYGLQHMDLHKSDKTVTLNRIDLSGYPAITEILDDVLSELDSVRININDPRYYLIKLSPHGNGDIAYITEHTHDNLPNAKDFIGYAFWGDQNNLIVVEGNTEHSVKFEKNPQTKTFCLDRGLPIIYDPRTWKYYIDQNIYARYIWSIGWIWHIPSEYEIKSMNSNIITFPKRHKK